MLTANFPWLTAIILLPLLASFLIPVIPDKEGKTVRWFALGVGLADFILMCYVFLQKYDLSNPNLQLVEKIDWVPQIGLSWAVSVDGISAPLVLLAGLVTTLSILAAWQVDRKPRLFYFLMLLLYAAQIGVFVAQDLLLFFLMWEIELIPVYLLVSIWGGQKRRYAATKFLLYTAAASIFILVAGLAMALYGGGAMTFDMAELGFKDYPLALELVLYAGLLIAFGVKLAIFPLHTWLPDAHGEASAPVSMILAGVLLKMGGYGLIRLNMGLLPDAHIYFAPILAILGVVNIIYGAFASFGQQNMKRRLAYSSVSHMGFVLLGIASFTDVGISGAMLQMLSHGLIAAVLFFLAGVTYDRTHTLALNEMGGIAQAMPLTPIYLLSMLRQVFYGDGSSCDITNITPNKSNEQAVCFGTSCVLPDESEYIDAKPREIFIAVSFLALIVAIGFYPQLATRIYDVKTVAVNSEVRQAYREIAATRQNIYAETKPDVSAKVASIFQ